MNTVQLTGRLTRDIELRYTQTGKACGNFTLAIDGRRNEDGSKETNFIPCVAWGKTAETLSKNVGKGNRIGVSGRLQTRTYDNRDGKKVFVMEVIVERSEIIDWKDGKKDDPTESEFIPVEDVDLPF